MNVVNGGSVSVLEDCWGRHGIYEQVGLRSPTNGFCGSVFFVGCTSDDGRHDIIDSDGVSYSGKGFFKVAFRNCGRPSCGVCVDGWARSSSYKVAARLERSSEISGLAIEHFIVSPARKDCDLSPEVLCKLVFKALKVRGLSGGYLLLHAFRSGKFGLHFHYLGFLDGGYSCRGCEYLKHSARRWYCAFSAGSCGGFEQLTRRENLKDGFIVKVAEDREGNVFERRSVLSTLRYLLGHSSFRTDVKRPHVGVWVGSCNYRNLKFVAPKHRDSCPLCGDVLREKIHCGSRGKSVV